VTRSVCERLEHAYAYALCGAHVSRARARAGTSCISHLRNRKTKRKSPRMTRGIRPGARLPANKTAVQNTLVATPHVARRTICSLSRENEIDRKKTSEIKSRARARERPPVGGGGASTKHVARVAGAPRVCGAGSPHTAGRGESQSSGDLVCHSAALTLSRYMDNATPTATEALSLGGVADESHAESEFPATRGAAVGDVQRTTAALATCSARPALSASSSGTLPAPL
jgi:hypothetical protein